jgi:hypothetical protein
VPPTAAVFRNLRREIFSLVMFSSRVHFYALFCIARIGMGDGCASAERADRCKKRSRYRVGWRRRLDVLYLSRRAAGLDRSRCYAPTDLGDCCIAGKFYLRCSKGQAWGKSFPGSLDQAPGAGASFALAHAGL